MRAQRVGLDRSHPRVLRELPRGSTAASERSRKPADPDRPLRRSAREARR